MSARYPDDPVLLHGFRVSDLDRMVRVVMARGFMQYIEPNDRYGHAFSAVAEALVTAEGQPSETDLVRAGMYEVGSVTRQVRHHHGVDPRNLHLGLGGMKGHAKYWWLFIRGSDSDIGERVVERVAVWQVLEVLVPYQRRAVVALADADGDYGVAAAGLGLSRGVFRTYMALARRNFKMYWLWDGSDDE